MRRTLEAKAESRDRILAEGARAFLSRGIDGTSVGEVMQAAGMTHGGFYRHFSSKEALLAAAVETAFDALVTLFDARQAAHGKQMAIDAYRQDYLSPEHLSHPEAGCPVAALGGEAARLGSEVQASYAAGAEALITRLAGVDGGPEVRAAAIRTLAGLVGAVVTARAVGPGALADEILAALRGTVPSAETEATGSAKVS